MQDAVVILLPAELPAPTTPAERAAVCAEPPEGVARARRRGREHVGLTTTSRYDMESAAPLNDS